MRVKRSQHHHRVSRTKQYLS